MFRANFPIEEAIWKQFRILCIKHDVSASEVLRTWIEWQLCPWMPPLPLLGTMLHKTPDEKETTP
jgi:hypothetical protein